MRMLGAVELVAVMVGSVVVSVAARNGAAAIEAAGVVGERDCGVRARCLVVRVHGMVVVVVLAVGVVVVIMVAGGARSGQNGRI